MRAILALGRFRMDLEMALLSRADMAQASTEAEVHEVESNTSRPIIGFIADDLDDEG